MWQTPPTEGVCTAVGGGAGRGRGREGRGLAVGRGMLSRLGWRQTGCCCYCSCFGCCGGGDRQPYYRSSCRGGGAGGVLILMIYTRAQQFFWRRRRSLFGILTHARPFHTHTLMHAHLSEGSHHAMSRCCSSLIMPSLEITLLPPPPGAPRLLPDARRLTVFDSQCRLWVQRVTACHSLSAFG